MQGPQPASRPALAALLCATLLGAAIRLAAVEIAPPQSLIGDEFYYVDVASRIAEGRGHVSDLVGARAAWPPAYPWLLSHFISPRPAGDGATAALSGGLRFQALLGSALVLTTGLLGWTLFGARVAVWSAFGVALYPTLVAYSQLFWSEMLFAVLLTLALAGAVEVLRTRGPALAAGTGALFGLAGLTREAGLVIGAACAAWWLWCAPADARRRLVLCAAVMGVSAAAVVLPWTVRNYRLFGELVPVATVGWLGVVEGNTFGDAGLLQRDGPKLIEFRRRYFAIPDEMARRDMARAHGLALVRAEQPLWAIKKVLRTAGYLTSPNSFVMRKIDQRAYGPVNLAVARAVLLATVLSFIFVYLASAAALPVVPGMGRRSLPVFVVVALFTLHALVHVSTRYRMPLMPLAIVYAAWAVGHPAALRDDLRERRWLLPGLALLVLLGLGIPQFAEDFVSLWRTASLANFP